MYHNGLSIGKTAKLLGVCVNTLRNWHKSGFLIPQFKTAGGHRRYNFNDITKITHQTKQNKTIAYARVSTHDQKQDLQTQIQRLQAECNNRNYTNVEVISDLGSGMNYTKKGLKLIIKLLINREISRLVILRQDRLLRFGADLIFQLCKLTGCEVVIIDPISEDPKKSIVDDVLAILTVFSARCNGMRSHSNKKALQSI